MATLTTKTDDLVLLLEILGAAPSGGLTIDEIYDKTRWPNRMIHQRLIDLGSQVGNEKRRVNKVKSTYYFLKAQ